VRHSTGLPCVGLKGTVVSVPHSEQVVRVSVRTRVPPCARLALHCLQRFGSFLNCLSWKNICSPAVKTNFSPQSTHFSTRSTNSIDRLPRSRSVLTESGIYWGKSCRARYPVFVCFLTRARAATKLAAISISPLATGRILWGGSQTDARDESEYKWKKCDRPSRCSSGLPHGSRGCREP
jgi:hypothetical protein